MYCFHLQGRRNIKQSDLFAAYLLLLPGLLFTLKMEAVYSSKHHTSTGLLFIVVTVRTPNSALFVFDYLLRMMYGLIALAE
jgi:hypothetical protein